MIPNECKYKIDEAIPKIIINLYVSFQISVVILFHSLIRILYKSPFTKYSVKLFRNLSWMYFIADAIP